jgi:predicted enzyme related to lactoylglutathione lyase
MIAWYSEADPNSWMRRRIFERAAKLMYRVRFRRRSMPNAPTHFEIPADDVERAKRFYERTFGWKIKAYPMPPGQEYWGVTTIKKGEPGINGGLMKRNMPGQPFTNYINVKSIDAMHQAVQANGGTIVMPKQEVGPGVGWISVFRDPENNVVGLHQAAPPAPKKAAPKKAARRTAKKRGR